MRDILQRLHDHATTRRHLTEELPQLIWDARDAGLTWNQIADHLEMSRAGIVKASKRVTDDAE